MSKKIVMILANGFEEAEAIIPADVLKRLGFDVTLAGLNEKKVTGAHDIVIEADCALSDIKAELYDVVILPGGMPGSSNLRESDDVMALVSQIYDNGGLATAICAAPIALQRAGVIEGKTVTAYPGFEQMLEGADYTGNRTEQDGRVITGKGPGAAFEFAAKIAGALGKEQEVQELFGNMFVKL